MTKKLNYKSIFSNLKNVWKYAKGHKGYMILYFASSLFGAFLGIVVPLLSAKMLIYLNSSLFQKLIILGAIIFVCETFSSIFATLSNNISQKLFNKITLDIQVDLVKETFLLDIKNFDDNSSGIFIDRLRNDSTELGDVFGTICYYITQIIGSIGIYIAILIINVWMFLFFVIYFVVFYILEEKRISKLFTIRKKIKKINENNTGFANEIVRGIRDIKVLNIGDNFINVSKERLSKSIDEENRLLNVNSKYYTINDTVVHFFNFAFLILGSILVTVSNLALENFVVLYMYRDKVMNFTWQFSSFIAELKTFDLAATRVFELMNNNFPKEKFGNTSLDNVNGNIEFKNVSFSYNKTAPVLNDISFTIESNKTTGFVGKSGTGKTTIFSLISKLYETDKGKVLFDGKDIKSLTCQTIRDNITIISQNPYIFNMSIRDNLKIVRPNASRKEIEAACKMACIDDFIESLPKKYNTIVGEGGKTLSGGQMQRLAIARALLKKTKIILLDEATSALDNETQAIIQKSINEMKIESTVVIIAHRLSTIVNCDKLYFIENGKVLASGTHEDLISNCQSYKELYKSEVLK